MLGELSEKSNHEKAFGTLQAPLGVYLAAPIKNKKEKIFFSEITIFSILLFSVHSLHGPNARLLDLLHLFTAVTTVT